MKLFTALVCMLLPAAIAAQQAATPDVVSRRAGDELTVFLATYGPGDQVWEQFGHNAIWVNDGSTGATSSYNYGMFFFDQPAFVPRLMKGRMLYSMWVNNAQDEVNHYTATNRTVTVQRLNLTADQKAELHAFLEWNWLPENREYLYDYFRDNCSTRLRDALDLVLDGEIRAALTGVPTSTTYRSHSLRLTAASLPTYTGLMIGLGLPTDRPIDAWQETFVPMKLMEQLRTVEVTDEQGRRVPLVASEEVLVDAPRADPPGTPPSRTVGYLIAGLLLAALIVGLGQLARGPVTAARGRRAVLARVALAGFVTVWAATAGGLGLILALLWLATDHTAAYPNANLLLLNPLALMLAVAGPLALGSRTPGPGRSGFRYRTARLAEPLALTLLALSLLALVLLLLPWQSQYNGPLIALVLPVHAAIAFVLYHVSHGNVSLHGDRSDESPQAAAV